MGLCITQINASLPTQAQAARFTASAASFLAVLGGEAEAAMETEQGTTQPQTAPQASSTVQAAATAQTSPTQTPPDQAGMAADAAIILTVPSISPLIELAAPLLPESAFSAVEEEVGRPSEAPEVASDDGELDEVDYSLTIAALGTAHFISPVVDLRSYALAQAETQAASDGPPAPLSAVSQDAPKGAAPQSASGAEAGATPPVFRLTAPTAPPSGSKVETFVTLAQGELGLNQPLTQPAPLRTPKVEAKGIWRLWGRADVAGVAKAKEAPLTPAALSTTAQDGADEEAADSDALFLEGEKTSPEVAKASPMKADPSATQPVAAKTAPAAPAQQPNLAPKQGATPAPELSASAPGSFAPRKGSVEEEIKVSAPARTAAPAMAETAPREGGERRLKAEPASQPASDPETMRARSDVYRQVVEGARVVFARGGERAVIRLSPESLGNVHIEITRTQEGLTAHFRVESQEARDALTTQMPQLKESFEARGVHLTDAQVLLGDGGDAHAEGRSGAKKEGRARAAGFSLDAIEETAEDSDTVWSPWGFEARA